MTIGEFTRTKKTGFVKDIFDATLYAKKINNSTGIIELVDTYLSNPKSRIDKHLITSIISSFGDVGLLGRSIAMLKDMQKYGVTPNEFHYGAVIQSCRKAGQWEMSLALLERMKKSNIPHSEKRNIPRDTVSYSIAITAYGQLGLMEESITLFNSIDTGVYNALITACERNGYWDVAMDLLLVQMPHQGRVAPDSRTFAATISACGRAKKWREALFVFETMKQS
eukprot:gene5342-10686_t